MVLSVYSRLFHYYYKSFIVGFGQLVKQNKTFEDVALASRRLRFKFGNYTSHNPFPAMNSVSYCASFNLQSFGGFKACICLYFGKLA